MSNVCLYDCSTNEETTPRSKQRSQNLSSGALVSESVSRTTILCYSTVNARIKHVTTGHLGAQRRGIWPSAWQVWASGTQSAVSICTSVFLRRSYLEQELKE